MTDTELLQDFKKWLAELRDAAHNTVRAYGFQLNNLVSFLTEQGKSLTTANYDDFIAWRAAMKADREPRGISLAIASARCFYRYAEERNILRPNPFPSSLKVSVKDQEPIDVPTVAQFLEMRQKARTGPLSRTDAITCAAVLETLAGTGLRLDALLTLRVQHLNLDGARPCIVVDSNTMACKGQKAGTIPMSPYAASALQEYLAAHPPADGAVIFPLKTGLVREMLDKCTPEGLHFTPHSLRHFYCSMTYFRNFDGEKNDILWVRDAAGHSSISTTDGYLKLARRVIQSELDWELWALGKSETKGGAA